MRRALLELADRHGLVILADEVYGDLAYDGPVPPLGSLDPDGPIVAFSSLSKAYLAPGWRTGWLAVGRSPRLDDLLAAMKKLADGRLCSNGPTQYAIAPALLGDRSHQDAFRAALRARAELTTARFNAIPGCSCVAPTAAFYAMPKVALPPGGTDEQYIVGLLRATGVLCVYGSGFGTPPRGRVLPRRVPREPGRAGQDLRSIDAFTRSFPARVTSSHRSASRATVALVHRHGGRRAAPRGGALSGTTVLMLVYVSALLAIGLAPIVRAVRAAELLPVGTRPFPRWLAILDAVRGAARHVGGPRLRSSSRRSLRQAQRSWPPPRPLRARQQFLIDRGLVDHELTMSEALQKAPTGMLGAGATR